MTENELIQFLTEFKDEIINAVSSKANNPQKQLFTLKEAAEYLGVSYNTFQKFRYEGLKVFEFDGTKRVYKEEIDKFIEKYSYKIGG